MDGTGSAARFYRPQGVAVDGNGNLYVAEWNNHTIRKVVIASGAVTTLAGTAGMPGSADGNGTAARFRNPTSVTADGAGNLYVADYSTIRHISLANGDVTTLVGVPGQRAVRLGPLPASLNSPAGIAALPGGVLYIVDTTENAILSVR